MEKHWVMVRITRDTHNALCRIRDSLEVAEEMNLVQLQRDHTSHVSLNHVIEKLIEQRDKHAARRSRSATRRRRPRTAAADPRPEDLAGGGPPPEDLPPRNS